MENETHIKKEMLLPSSLINDIEFDELDKELQIVEGKDKNGSTGSKR